MLGRIEALRAAKNLLIFLMGYWTIECFVFSKETQIVKTRLIKILRHVSISHANNTQF